MSTVERKPQTRTSALVHWVFKDEQHTLEKAAQVQLNARAIFTPFGWTSVKATVSRVPASRFAVSN